MKNAMNALQPFPPPADLSVTLLPPTSRYHGLPILTHTRADGRKIAYFERRFVPQQDRFVTLQEHEIQEHERMDHLAGAYLSDAEQFWRIADANNELDAAQLTAEAGRRVRITLPEGIPEPRHA